MTLANTMAEALVVVDVQRGFGDDLCTAEEPFVAARPWGGLERKRLVLDLERERAGS